MLGALQQELEVAQAQRGEAMAAVRAGEQRYELALRGSQDGLWEWDIAAGSLIAQRAGCRATELSGQPLRFSSAGQDQTLPGYLTLGRTPTK